MAEFANIRFRIDDRVARITLARPPLNILNIAMMREIGTALDECSGTRKLAAIVFDADPGTRAFSAGVAVEEHVPQTVVEMLESFHYIFRRLNAIERPVVASVDGAALGGGCELAAGCDFVIASDRAKFGQPEIKLGVFPPVATVLLPRIVGDKKAREMILLGEIIDANEAYRCGLVNHVVPADQLTRKTTEVIQQLRQLSSSSLGITRRALYMCGGDFDQLLRTAEALYLDELMKTEDANEGVRAFTEKRKSEWRHR